MCVYPANGVSRNVVWFCFVFFFLFSSFCAVGSSFIKSRDLFDFETVTELKQHEQAARITCAFCFMYYLNDFNCNFYSRFILYANAITKVNRFYFHETNEKNHFCFLPRFNAIDVIFKKGTYLLFFLLNCTFNATFI